MKPETKTRLKSAAKTTAVFASGAVAGAVGIVVFALSAYIKGWSNG